MARNIVTYKYRHQYYGVSYLARRLRVSTSTIYYWMKESERGQWAHKPVPAPIACVTNSGFEGPVGVWSESQLATWDEWYADYKSNKWKQSS
jgi:hypothetical protein